MKLFLANSISQIFSPMLLWPLFLVVLLFNTGLTAQQQSDIWLPWFLLEIGLPLVLFIVLHKLGKISDMEITNVRERRLYFVLLTLSHVASVWLLFAWGNELIGYIRLVGLVVATVGTIITFYWKISVHMATATFVYTSVMLLFVLQGRWAGWWLMLFLPLIAWSRVVKRKHTVMQTIVGTVLTLLICVIGYGLL